MTDYKKILDEQLKTLDDTINTQNNEKREKSSLIDKVMQYSYDKSDVVQTGVKAVGVTGMGYIAGVVLPIVSGGTIALAALVGYVGKKCYDKHQAKKEQ